MSLGKLIVLEGIDGAGKTTQLELIKQYLKEKYLVYDFLHFPKYGHNQFSEIIARYLRGEFGKIDEVDPFFVANIYAMDKYLYLPELLEKLENNDVVLLDRYVFSNIAFQGAKYIDEKKSKNIQKWIRDLEFGFLELPYPNLTLFLDVPIEITEKRIESRKDENREYLNGANDIHEEDIVFQKRVRDIYLSLNETKYKIIETTVKSNDELIVLSPEALFNNYKEILIKTLSE